MLRRRRGCVHTQKSGLFAPPGRKARGAPAAELNYSDKKWKIARVSGRLREDPIPAKTARRAMLAALSSTYINTKRFSETFDNVI